MGMDQETYGALKGGVEEFLGSNWRDLYPVGHPGHSHRLSDDEAIDYFVAHADAQSARQVVDDIRTFIDAPTESAREKVRFVHENVNTMTYIPSRDDQAAIDWLERQSRAIERQLGR